MTKEQVLNKLRELSKKANKSYLTLEDIRRIPKLQYYIYIYFENFAQALKEAGLESSTLAKKISTSDEELLTYLYDLQEKIGRPPSTLSVNRDGKYNYKIFTRRFGSIKKANELAEKKYKSEVNNLTDPKELINKTTISKEPMEPIEEFEYKGQFYGVAAENLVVAELLYRGYEAYLINVDLGLDVMAQKEGKVFYFQVKNISFDKSNTRTIPITKTSYLRNKFNNVYYFFIMQKYLKRDYIIIPQLKLLEYEGRGLINTDSNENVNITFSKKENIYQIIFKNEKENLDAYTNSIAWKYLS